MGRQRKPVVERRRGKVSFGRLEYWNEAFDTGEFAQPFDWLASWGDLCSDLEALIPNKASKVLVPGCGNAPFQLEMYAAGYQNLVCGDNSEVVVKKMQTATKDSYPGIEWDLMDASDMPYPEGSFDAVVDKSLMDALLCSDDAAKTTRLYFDEVFRVLAPGGVLVLISCHKERSLRANLRGRDCHISCMREVQLRQLAEAAVAGQQLAFQAGESSAVESRSSDAPQGAMVTFCACFKGHGAAVVAEAPNGPASQEPSLRKKIRDERRKAAKMQRRMVQAHMEDADLA